jgi:hypothetical protein
MWRLFTDWAALPLTRLSRGGPVTALRATLASDRSSSPRHFDSSEINAVDTQERWLIAAIEEYKSLRLEIVDAISSYGAW